VTSPSVAQRKQALVERASLARMHLRGEIRGLRATLADATTVRPLPAARAAMGLFLLLAGAARGARLLARVQRALIVAKVSVALFGYIASRVRNRTDGLPAAPHHRPSTGELQ
jgi:hypothetical protein